MSGKKPLKKSNRKPLISIVIPSYNKGKFIKKTLQSITSQNYTNYEVLIMDAESTDDTQSIIAQFAKKYPNISYYRKKDNGQFDAINKGMTMAKGDLLTFINADDYFETGALSEMSKIYTMDNSCLWIIGKGRAVDVNGYEVAGITTEYKNWLMLKNKYYLLQMVNYIFQPSVFITKKAYEQYGPFIGVKKWVIEYDMWLKLGRVKMPKISEKIISNFRLTANTASMTAYEDILRMDEKVLLKYSNNPFIQMLHYLHNICRIIISKLIFSKTN